MSESLWSMDCNIPGFLVLHYLLEFAKTRVGDAIQTSQPLSPASPPALNVSQHQGLGFPMRRCSLHQVARVLELQPSVLPMNIQGWLPLGLTGLISFQSKGFSGVLSSTTFWKYQFFWTHPSLWFNSHTLTWLLEKPYLWLHRPLSAEWCLCLLICCLGWS